MRKYLLFSTLIFIFVLHAGNLFAQTTDNLQFDGNIRFAHIGNDLDADGIGGENTLLRIRPGLRYTFNENTSFRARLAYVVSVDGDPFEVTVNANGKRQLAFGSLTFDEFYYHYTKDNTELKFGRFQNSLSVLSNAGRSQMRFQSNANFVHWSDGAYWKQTLNNGWYSEAILEYQLRNNVTYAYGNNLTFSENEHNFTTYLGLENRERDDFNIIQKGFGFFYAPSSFLNDGEIKDYIAFTSRIAFDFPQKDFLHGGSIRVAGEFGQTLTTDIEDGTSLVASIGVNNVADQHEFMIEFSNTDRDWLTASVYAPATNEMELRYRFFATSQLNFDVRYRVRTPQNDNAPYVYSTFLRATYSF